jgi:hypothetical protein
MFLPMSPIEMTPSAGLTFALVGCSASAEVAEDAGGSEDGLATDDEGVSFDSLALSPTLSPQTLARFRRYPSSCPASYRAGAAGSNTSRTSLDSQRSTGAGWLRNPSP